MATVVRPSATMALAAIEQLSDEIDALRAQEKEKMNARNVLIRDAKRAGLPYTRLGRASRLGLNRLQAIVAMPDPADPE